LAEAARPTDPEGDAVLLLVTLGLILASGVLLIVGFVQDTLGFIYVSLLCAGVAGVVLFVFARQAKRNGDALAGARLAAATAGPGPTVAIPRPTVSDLPVDHPDRPRVAEVDPLTEALPLEAAATTGIQPDIQRPEPTSVETGSPDGADGAEATEGSRRGEGEVDDRGDVRAFPIPDYDRLRAAEILPLLSRLDPDELQEVRDRELAGKARATVLDRIEERLGRRGASSARGRTETAAVAEPVAGDPAQKAAKKASASRAPAKKAAAATGDPAPGGSAPKAAQPAAGQPAGEPESQPRVGKKATGKPPGVPASAKPAPVEQAATKPAKAKTAGKRAAAKPAAAKTAAKPTAKPAAAKTAAKPTAKPAAGNAAPPGPDADPSR
jgi:hypothetical protein